MAYSGYLMKVGDYNIPLSKIKADSYKAQKSVTDLDSYVDANGVLHRTALEHFGYKVEFELVPMLDNSGFASIMSSIYSQFTNATERKFIGTFYVPELDTYISTDMYMPDVVPQIYFADGTKIQYDAIRLAFIGY